MSRIKIYDCEQFSVFDIISFVEAKGHHVLFRRQGEEDPHEREHVINMGKPEWRVRKYPSNKFHIVSTDVYIDIPKEDINGHLTPCIRFENYPETKYFEESKKVYAMLKRTFAMKEDRYPESIKDEQKILDFVKKQHEGNAEGPLKTVKNMFQKIITAK